MCRLSEVSKPKLTFLSDSELTLSRLYTATCLHYTNVVVTYPILYYTILYTIY